MAKKDRISELVRFLSREGQKIVDNQLQNKGYTHRSHNLHDSYGWGVYVNRDLVASGFPDIQATKGKKWYDETIKGREAITDFLQNKYNAHDGIDLVVAVAMPYGEIIEDKYKYEVIATARDDVKRLASKFKNANFGIISHGSY